MQMIDTQTLPEAPTLALPPIVVGDTPIDPAEIAGEMQYHGADSPESAQLAAARALVIRELLRQEAAMTLGRDVAMDEQDAITTLLDQALSTPEPDDATCKRYFQAHRDRFCTPPRYRVRHVLLPAAPDDQAARDEMKTLGESLLTELFEHPERFDEFAQRYSACPSREAGGALGELAPGQTVKELDDALKHLPEGLHDRPLASRYGWHLVQIDQKIEGEALPLEAVINRVRHTLREQATRRALRHYLLALAETIGVTGVTLDDEAGGALMQ
ncbi:peptidylprolyl isomerase [Kushneria phyllosphaerae]|uniref:peptidylprolyl isomerase n=1 Tax=Kushneria phyllosphaerae TaxID=2100822 RepID=A0A2R8CHJ9_9GAMM|nr:peptidylprolyl isomerase [Kushneria phyllosphaerae]SPJ32371.1 putative parvulin-type peptidyl-prolyl cis-trans isomerase [Kushneria phyllosphaerae]